MLKKNKSLKSLALCFGLGYSAISLGNSFDLDLESKVENVAQEYCLKNREQYGGDYSVFNIKENILEIQGGYYNYEGYQGNYHLLINMELIDANVFINFDGIYISFRSKSIKLKGITEGGWWIRSLFIRRGGNVESILNNEGNEGDIIKYVYIGKFNKEDCAFKKNPDEATELFTLLMNDGELFYISYPKFGGNLYFNSEKTTYTLDVLGTIRNTIFSTNNNVIGSLTDILEDLSDFHYKGNYHLVAKKNLKELRNLFPDGKGESGFVYFKISEDSKLFLEYYMNYGSYLAIPRNFGDGQVFWIKGFENREPTLMTTPYRISADGIIYDTREKIVLGDAIYLNKPIATVSFRMIWDFNDSDSPVIGKLVDLKSTN